MRPDHPPVIRLEDYQAPDFLVDRVEMDIHLDGKATKIGAVLHLRRNPDGFDNTPLVLDGEDLVLTGLTLDGKPLPANAYTATPDKLVLPNPPARFRLGIHTVLDPAANKNLMGLYRSSGVYCTQCEAEGFRRITYFPDRPDILALYRVRLEASKSEAPLLLANGNRIAAGDIAGTDRHFAIWDDPHPKPSYLFAVVGGDLDGLTDCFVTRSGRKVALGLYVAKGKAERARYALDALKRSMRWDEEVFGCEYDLDVFNIVAVPDFNFGAMENKGLNIFNDKYVLASPETATDTDFANIEAVIAHEYFHNWTGNRITCRDWFQLCLKEGLTVFRDQEFSSDMRSRPVKRIADVRNLRQHQFAEDAGPLAHPVRPSAYREINNFYTVTVYEKGAELIRMLKTLIGAEAFARAIALYFAECDGAAATVEDFLRCAAQASGRDLAQFKRWYEQAGTPRLRLTQEYDAEKRLLSLRFTQNTPPTPGQPEKAPFVIPVRLGLLGEDGTPFDLGNGAQDITLTVDSAEKTVLLGDIDRRPVVSALRDFSAPVILDFPQDEHDLAVLARHDRDAFNRWQALQTLAGRYLRRNIAGERQAEPATLLQAVGGIVAEARRDPAFAALSLTLPADADLAREIGSDVDPDAIHAAHRALKRLIGKTHGAAMRDLHDTLPELLPYRPDAEGAGTRALRNGLLDFIAAGDEAEGLQRAQARFATASNMTDRLASLAVLCQIGGAAAETALEEFETRFGDEALAMDKWFALQAQIPRADTLETVRRLLRHRAFALDNPNRAKALIGGFANNQTQFHRADGAGYRFVADMVLALDPLNPQVAARLLTSFRSWRNMTAARRKQAEAALRKIGEGATLSADVRDIVDRSLQ